MKKLVPTLLVALVGSCIVVSSAATAQEVAAPPSIKQAGKIVYCTEAGFPPMEFFEANSATPVGFDIEMGNAIAKRMGVSAEFDNMGFDGLIAALLSKRCDAILSAMNATPTRKKELNFSDYLGDGYALIVRAGNPKGIAGYNAVCGLTIGVQVATTNLEEVTSQSKQCVADGKPAISIKTFQNDTGLRLALATNQIDAYNQTAATAAFAITQDPKTFQMGGAGPVAADDGIATRKDDPGIEAALDSAIKSLYADGTMKALTAKWHLTPYALPM
jgi:polar amino acid transport system substrate-binding protein